MIPDCFRRPGRLLRDFRLCRYCGAAVTWCPCVGPHYRSCDDHCPACLGSMWVAIIRSRASMIREALGDRPAPDPRAAHLEASV